MDRCPVVASVYHGFRSVRGAARFSMCFGTRLPNGSGRLVQSRHQPPLCLRRQLARDAVFKNTKSQMLKSSHQFDVLVGSTNNGLPLDGDSICLWPPVSHVLHFEQHPISASACSQAAKAPRLSLIPWDTYQNAMCDAITLK